MIVPTYPGHIVPRINFYGLEIHHGIFGGLNVSSGIFSRFCFFFVGIFLGFHFPPYLIVPVTLNLEYPPPPPPPPPGLRPLGLIKVQHLLKKCSNLAVW